MQNQLSGAIELEMGSDWFNSSGEVITDSSLGIVRLVVEASGPVLEGFETEREGVLSRCEFVAVMDDRLIFGYYVAIRVMFQLVEAILGGADVLGPQVVVGNGFLITL